MTDESGYKTELNIRDYFAAYALASLTRGNYADFQNIAIDAYKIADAMIKERKKEK